MKAPLLRLLILVTGILLLLALALPARAALPFRFSLDSYQPRPVAGGNFYGDCVGITDAADEMLSLMCIHNVTDATHAEIYRGPAGENGSFVYEFSEAEDPKGIIDLTAKDLADLVVENLNIRIVSPGWPNGRIRGQIKLQRPNDTRTLFAPLEGSQVVPSVSTSARGRCTVASFEPENADEVLVVCSHDVAGVSGASLRRGAPGDNGPILFDLGASPGYILFGTNVSTTAFPTFFDDLANGRLYVEIRSASHPAGELRGNLRGCWGDSTTLCLNQERFAVQMSVTLQGLPTFLASAVVDTPDAGQFFFLRPDNRELAIKILNACALNNRYWVFYGGTTDVAFSVTVTDTKTGAVWARTHAAGSPAMPVLDTNAFATCP